MSAWLSILMPSKRDDLRDACLASFERTAADFDAVELVVLVDGPEALQARAGRNVALTRPPTQPVNMSALDQACYEASTGRWVWFVNDDTVMETHGWDVFLRELVGTWPDGVALLWPDDGMFGARVACFPLVSRRLLDGIGFWPQPYRRYLLDNTLTEVVPENRKRYVPEVRLRHLNHAGAVGHALPDGRVYPVDDAAAAHDLAQWARQGHCRQRMRTRARQLMEA